MVHVRVELQFRNRAHANLDENRPVSVGGRNSKVPIDISSR